MTIFKNKLLPLLLALFMVVTMLPVSALAADDDTVTGTVGESSVVWTFDACCGRLIITGSGGCETFTSPEDQPWAAFRNEIKEVWFDGMATLTIENLAYWFDGCTSLETAEVPYTTPVIGTRAFADCPKLYRLMLYYSTTDFSIEPTAFITNALTVLEIDYIAELDEPMTVLSAYDWTAENRAAYFEDVYGTMLLATGYCSYCGGTYSYTLAYDQWTATVHCTRHWCSNCGLDQCGGVNGEPHTFSNGVCTKCGYDNGTGSGGGGETITCDHNSTYKSWSGCDWTEYCSDCGAYIDSGTSHNYDSGNWEYDSSVQHRRLSTCLVCGDSYYDYDYHSASTVYLPYSNTQHSYGSYCSVCGSYIDVISYESHNFSYGSWKNYSSSQHRRTVSCSICDYSSYEYASHSLTSGAWTSISATQHRRTLSCSCGYSTTETANHSLTYGAWASISDTQHQRTGSCVCGYSTTENGAHTDSNGDGYCDMCGYTMSRFSVTVPASLSLIVSENGKVFAADNAAIVNNSTGAVAITSVIVSAANGWRLVPFNSNMATAKVDAKLIGFSLNNAQSAVTGTSENLSLPGAWSIAKGSSLPLTYTAVVSAVSQPVNEQVLTIVFVLNWAA